MTSDVREFARFIAPLQSDPTHHMAMVGTAELGIANELEEFGTQLFVERDDEGAIVGAVGLCRTVQYMRNTCRAIACLLFSHTYTYIHAPRKTYHYQLFSFDVGL